MTRDKDDFYETEPELIRTYLSLFPLGLADDCSVIDPGCGPGVYGTVLRERYPQAHIAGVELNSDRHIAAIDENRSYNIVYWNDFRSIDTLKNYDLVIGNPPFRHAEEFYWKARECIHGNGTIDFLLRLGFLESEARYETLWSKGQKPTQVTVLNTRPSFTGDGKTYPGAFALFRWKFRNGYCNQDTRLEFMMYER